MDPGPGLVGTTAHLSTPASLVHAVTVLPTVRFSHPLGSAPTIPVSRRFAPAPAVFADCLEQWAVLEERVNSPTNLP